jgi:glutaredoxin-related protein
MDKTIIIIISAVILAGVSFWAWQSGFISAVFSGPAKPAVMPEGIVLFYGDGCPHCVNVEEYMTANNIEQKVKITRLEVWKNQSNAKLLVDTAVACKKDISGGVPVPFLWDGKNCLEGDQDIINFLSQYK